MILDERTEFFDGILIPQSAGTSILGDVVDTGANQRDLGNGEDIFWYVSCDVSGAGGTSAQFNLVTDDNASLSTPAIIASSPVIVLANLTAGRMLYMTTLPIEGVAYERYLGVQAVVAGTFTGLGAVSSGLTLDPKGWKAYKDAVN